MSQENTQVIASVSEHWLLGSLPLAGTRIQDALNDSSTEFVQLSDVEVYRRAKCQCVASLTEAVVPKCNIEFVVVPSNQHEAPVKRWNNLAARTVLKAFAIVNDCCISGELHLSTEPRDDRYTFSHQIGNFFALTGASLSLTGPGVEPLRIPLVFANKDFVNCFHIGEPAKLRSQELGRQTSAQPGVGNQEEQSLAELVKNLHGLLDEAGVDTESKVNSQVG